MEDNDSMIVSDLTKATTWESWSKELGVQQRLLKRWADGLFHRFHCVHCDTEGLLNRFITTVEGRETIICPTCNEYKGIEPYIEGYHY